MNRGENASNDLSTGSFEALCYPHNVYSLCFGRSKLSSILFFCYFYYVLGDFPLVKQLFTPIPLDFGMEFVYVVAHAH